MKKFIEMCDIENGRKAVDILNALSKDLKVTIEGYNVVRYEQCNQERTYILVSYEVEND